MNAQELFCKADYEGGIYELIRWGGPEVFEELGPDAVLLARTAEEALEILSSMLPDEHGDCCG